VPNFFGKIYEDLQITVLTEEQEESKEVEGRKEEDLHIVHFSLKSR
jgi:hypothetical protein